MFIYDFKIILCNIIINIKWGSTVDIQKFKAALGDPSALEHELNKNSSSDEEMGDRYNLLEKYGLKDMDENEIEELLGAYDRDSLNNKELESMERILSKKIHHAVTSIRDIKKAAVEVFIDNSDKLCGIVTIIVEYEHKGFLDRIMSASNNMNAETIELTQIEISELFKNSPELIENFEINVESF